MSETLNRELAAGRERAFAYEGALTEVYAAQFRRLGREAVARFTARATPREALVAAGDDQTPPGWVPPDVDEIIDLLEFDATAADAALRIHKQAIAAALSATPEIGLDVTSPFALPLLEQVGTKSVNLGLAARDVILKVISESYSQGLSVPNTARELRANIDHLSTTTARMQARTDLNGLANGANFAAVQVLGDDGPQYKRWLATEDERTRETHVEADGQIVALNQPFQVGDDSLMYPGDPSGTDEEVINCRCTLLFVDEPALVAAGLYDESEHPRAQKGHEGGGRWIKKGDGTAATVDAERQWTGPPVEPDPEFVNDIAAESWEGPSRWQTVDGEDFYGPDPMAQALKHGMTDAEYQAAVRQRAAEWLETAYVSSRVPAPLLDEILADGRMKSQFETQNSGGTLSNEGRRYSEDRMWGYAPDTPDTDRPIYGYMHKLGQADSWTDSYGEVELEMKHAIRDRTTWTDGDSFAQTMVPSPLGKPSHLSTDVEYGNDPLADGLGSSWYVEAQMHGGVTVDDIAAIHVPYDWREDQSGITGWYEPEQAAVIKATLQKYQELGIPVEYDRGQLY